MVRRLFLFNPDHEMAVASGNPFYTPPANIVRMADELSYLPAYFSDPGDGILLPALPDPAFLNSRAQIFGLAPEILLRYPERPWEAESFEPWGWTPRECRLFRSCNESWAPERKELYSRKTALQVLEKMCRGNTLFESDRILPRICISLEEVKSCIADDRCVIKAPWSSSGKGLLFIEKAGLSAKAEEWIGGVLRRQGYVTVERQLDKVYDFALEFYADEFSCIQFLGYSAFRTGSGGEYRGNYIGEPVVLQHRIEKYVGPALLDQVKNELLICLGTTLGSRYKGYLGVDLMVYRDAKGGFRLQPCVEINLRYNMGILALFLSKRYLAPGSSGYFSIAYHRKPGVLWQESEKATRENPPVLEKGKIKKGYFPLTPVIPSVLFSAFLQVETFR